MQLFKRGLIAGSFDILHPGYVRMFKESKAICEYLIVALQDDPTVDRPTKCKPVQTWSERKEILESIKFIDEIVRYNSEKDLLAILDSINYDVRILGDDYREKNYTGKSLNKPVYFCQRNHAYSTTKLKTLISESLKT